MLITRESKVKNYLLIESRPRWHWACFDFLGLLMRMTSNSVIHVPFLFAFVYKNYIKFVTYSRPKSNLVVKQLATTEPLSPEYSQLIEEAIQKLESTVPPTIN